MSVAERKYQIPASVRQTCIRTLQILATLGVTEGYIVEKLNSMVSMLAAEKGLVDSLTYESLVEMEATLLDVIDTFEEDDFSEDSEVEGILAMLVI